ncbi:hypothetical protein HK096_004638 [Nowakowskiella sp. JEL0078]|nr:hypothetical protein HK096_004638 [Nowakowskiella sp. JEL0078]
MNSTYTRSLSKQAVIFCIKILTDAKPWYMKATKALRFIKSPKLFDCVFSEWSTKLKSKQVVEYDTIHKTPVDLLSLVVNSIPGPRGTSSINKPNYEWSNTEILPPAFHLILFPSKIPEIELSSDGYESEIRPPDPFVKRMWAGGDFEWYNAPLRIGDKVKQIITILNIEKKPSIRGDNVFVGQKRELFTDLGLSLVEKRNYVFIEKDKVVLKKNTLFSGVAADFIREIVPTNTTLFRYSALTFNSHKIHLDPEYTKQNEGYPDLLVHGPLTCTLLLDLLKRNKPTQHAVFKSFSYRAVSPLFVNKQMTLHGRLKGEDTTGGTKKWNYDLWATNHENCTAMFGKCQLVLMIVGDFVEDYEVMVPFQALEMLGIQVDAVCPGKVKGDTIATAVHDFVGFQTYAESRGHNFVLTATFDEIKAADYQGLFIPGGRAPEYLRLNPKVIELAQAFFTTPRPVAAVCHGMQILTAANVLKGRSVTAYPACGPECSVAGANFKDVGAAEVVVDKNLVSSPAWPGHPKALAAFIKLLGVEITFTK